jgi:hypothetical protein
LASAALCFEGSCMVLLFSWSADDCYRTDHTLCFPRLSLCPVVCTQRTISLASLASMAKRESGCWSHCSCMIRNLSLKENKNSNKNNKRLCVNYI